ncbi:MAG TPA: hypothetical protein VFY87_11515 [Geminicoccaceae bacterium]|jgi:hypothetical protein|nr:hypothetical protein [Geminicoccaceae bacterium]
MRTLAALAALLLFATACTASVRAPEVQLRAAPVKVVVGGGGGGGSCPPGQAKKGVC